MRKITYFFILLFMFCGLFLPSNAYCTDKSQTQISQPQNDKKILAKDFSITGQTLYPQQQLVSLLSDYKNKELTMSDLNKCADIITRFFRSEGYVVATAYLPEQKMNDGIVEISVMVGSYDKIIVNNNLNISDSIIKKQLGNVKSGELIKKDSLERAVWLLGDLAGAEAKATLQPGDKVGTSNLVINMQPRGNQLKYSASFDNFGNKYTGKDEGGASLYINNLASSGDVFTARGLVGNDLSTGVAAWQMPIANGQNISLSYSKLSYNLGDEFASLGSDGNAKILGLQWNYSLLRSGTSNTYLSTSYSHKKLEEHPTSATEDNKHSYVYSFGINGNRQDKYMGGGISAFSLTYNVGNLSIETPSVITSDAAGPGTNGDFGKWNWSYMRNQLIGSNKTLLVSMSGQLSSKNLDSSEKMSLGGASGVRAYPQGEACGDEGYLITTELRKQVSAKKLQPGTLQAAAFFDIGGVKLYKDAYASGDNHRLLYGAGIGFLYNSNTKSNTACRLDYAFKLDNEKAVSDTDRSGRLWLQLTKDY